MAVVAVHPWVAPPSGRFQLVMLKSKKKLIIWKTTFFKTHFGSTKMGSNMFNFSTTSISPWLISNKTICIIYLIRKFVKLIHLTKKLRKNVWHTWIFFSQMKSLHFEMFFTNHDLYINSVFQNPTIKRKEWFMFIFWWKAASPIFRFIFTS